MDKPWRSAIFKSPVAGPVALIAMGLEGDAQADRRHHGGLDMAVLACSADRLAAWREELDRDDIGPGAFGENLTVAGLDEATVCIGDRFAIGPARLEVSQPRVPCWKLDRRWRMTDLSARVDAKIAGGWYLRVLEEGRIEAGMAVKLIERPHPEWTVARAYAMRRAKGRDLEAAARLAAVAALAPQWRESLGVT
jgi:MOSC domain-containing protein YiiM